MLKFRCQHCRQRIAVGARHLGKLVTCPECGEPTHPLAEQIVSLHNTSSATMNKANGGAAVASATSRLLPAHEKSDHCANCGQALGRLQQRASWMGHCVCAACHARLSAEMAAMGRALVGGKSGRSDAAESVMIAPPPSTGSMTRGQAARRVAVRRAPAPSRLPGPARLLARGAGAAGSMVLAIGKVTLATSRQGRRISSDGSELALARESDVTPAPPSLHGRLFFVLVIVSLAGMAVYGALTLLQALAGYLTAAAFILLAVVGGYLLLRVSLSASRRFMPMRSPGRVASSRAVSR